MQSRAAALGLGRRSPRSSSWSAPRRPGPRRRCSPTCTGGAPHRRRAARGDPGPTDHLHRRQRHRPDGPGRTALDPTPRRRARSSSARPSRTCSRPAAAPGPRSRGTRRGAGLAGGAPPGARRRPARRTGPRSATSPPRGASSPGSYRPLREPRRHPARHRRRLPRRRRWASRRTARTLIVHPNTVRYRLGRHHQGDRLRPGHRREAHDRRGSRCAVGPGLPPTRAASRAGRRADPDTSHTIRTRLASFGGTLQIATECSSPFVDAPVTAHATRLDTVIVIVCPGQGSQTPGFLAPWLELPGLRDQLERTLRRRRRRPRHPRHDVRRRHDQGHRGRPAAHRGRRAARPARPVPARPPTRSPCLGSGWLAGHSVGEITAAAAAGVLTATGRDALRPPAWSARWPRRAPSPRPA